MIPTRFKIFESCCIVHFLSDIGPNCRCVLLLFMTLKNILTTTFKIWFTGTFQLGLQPSGRVTYIHGYLICILNTGSRFHLDTNHMTMQSRQCDPDIGVWKCRRRILNGYGRRLLIYCKIGNQCRKYGRLWQILFNSHQLVWL